MESDGAMVTNLESFGVDGTGYDSDETMPATEASLWADSATH